MKPDTGAGAAPGMRPWGFVVWFGTVSLLADVVYEGARSVTGPLLASLGASSLVVGVVTGAGEAAALGLRLVSGPLADRTHRFWGLAIAGYALTVVSVPLLGVAGVLWAACVLVIAERVGKAVRSPAKDTLLSHATAATGRGRGFAVHEAMDQIGALVGPLLVAGVLALTGDDYAPALGVLAVPGAAALGLLVRLRSRVPDPEAYERGAAPKAPRAAAGGRLPTAFWTYAAFTAATTTGFATFGVLSYHLVQRHLLVTAWVPVLYAGAMAVDAVAALVTGWLYDRYGPRVLVALPVLTAAVPCLAFTHTLAPAAAGSLVWGAAMGIQESTLRAVVADLVPSGRRATAYGVFAGAVGAASLAGGALTGGLYGYSVPVLITVVVVIQVLALALLGVTTTRRTRPRTG
ncbi:major facilitator superfamily protein [Streptomyces hygroscopicus subsp. sporocinereus]|uniref:Major facilitator superfamily protein n=1 Tax=Streptomyces hygroscopicus TaxID=1912 RepID=A0ABQ3TTJ5_STRHY|nr:MFS transporter [Streptomyces hygroscopicus]GHJ26651.1 major facilitator superfamily protein [Streptomyces hygroscopicus]